MNYKITTLFLVIFVSQGLASKLGKVDHSLNQTREPDEDDIHFYLWTRKSGIDHVEVQLDIDSLYNNGFDPEHPTIFVCHGFSSEGSSFAKQFVKAFHEVGDYNILSIDWEKLALWYDYFGAAKRTRFVAEHAANLVGILAKNGGLSKVHLIGHSLGAHVVGFIGKKIQELGYGKIPRITGLDPAMPAFELASYKGRIDKGDAELVDIIHTNSGMLWNGCLSNWNPIGHYDFYPAGGSHQPGCTDICVATVCDNNSINDLIMGGCSHSRSHQYYIGSILTLNSFKSWQCESWEKFENGECCQEPSAYMGFNLDRSSPEGSYYLMVNEEAPFSKGESGNFC